MKSSVKKRHAHMVGDLLRTDALLRAVKKAVRRGDIVVDIGTGLGVLAIAAAKAGASRVWAIDCDAEALDAARKNVRNFHKIPSPLRGEGQGEGDTITDKIIFIEGLSFDLDIENKADVILCETVGSYAFDENILLIISDAKKRFLKKSGRIIPQKLELWCAPIKCLPKLEGFAEIAQVKACDLISEPVKLFAVDFQNKIPKSIHIKQKFSCKESGVVYGFAVWPRVIWQKGEITDSSPKLPPTHWKQGILPVECRKVKEGEKIGLEFIIAPHPEDPKKMTERLWRVLDV